MAEVINCTVAIVGAGPAGLTAAAIFAEQRIRCVIIDESAVQGGRIHAGRPTQASAQASSLFPNIATNRYATLLTQSRVVSAENGRLLVEHNSGAMVVQFEKLIIATGARELLLPFTGWTTPGLMGASGLQLMIKNGMDVHGKKIVLAGTGPLLIAAAATAIDAGAQVRVVERVPLASAVRFAMNLLRYPDRALQAATYLAKFKPGMIHFGARLLAVVADGATKRVQIALADGAIETLSADFVGSGFGLVPNTELAVSMGCTLDQSKTFARVKVDSQQRSSIENVYAVGEVTGIGGRAKSIAEARVAAWTIGGDATQVADAQRAVRREQKYAAMLESIFPLPREANTALDDDTIICRCEDVRWGALKITENWREARLQSRCGMGFCQGRVCGAALTVLKQFKPDDQRTPFIPCRLDTLAADNFQIRIANASMHHQ